MNLREESISSEVIYKGQIITVKRDIVRLPNGKQASRELVEHVGGVAVVAVDRDENIYMVRQYRRPFDDLILELPAGKLDEHEDPLACCIRELEEETGLTAGNCEYLGAFMVSPGFCKELIHIYLARDLSQGTAHLDPDEFLEVEKLPLKTLMNMIMNNELPDAKTVIGILKTNEILRAEKASD